MTERAWPGRLDATVRVVGALVGTLPVAVLASVCLARLLPLTEPTRLALGFTLAVPLWIAAMCVAFLARSGARAWVVCLGATVLFAALVYGVPQ